MKIASAALISSVFLLIGCSKQAAEADATQHGVMIHKTADMRLGQGPDALYARTCGYCHGKNLAPVLLGRELPPEAIEAFARSGSKAMPAFRPTEISDAQLASLANWISESKPSKADYGR